MEAIVLGVIVLYPVKVVSHTAYLMRADALMGRFHTMSFFEFGIKYTIAFTPVFIQDPLAEAKYSGQLAPMKAIAKVTLLIVLLGIVIISIKHVRGGFGFV